MLIIPDVILTLEVVSVMSTEFGNNMENIASDPIKISGCWVISAEKIFSSQLKDFKDFSRVFDIEFGIKEFSITDGVKFSDSVIQANDINISMPLGAHVVLIQKYLAKRTVMKKVLIKRLMMINNKLTAVDELEFGNAKFQSFSMRNELVSFSLRYHTYSYSYTSYKNDGTKSGASAMSVDAKWDVK